MNLEWAVAAAGLTTVAAALAVALGRWVRIELVGVAASVVVFALARRVGADIPAALVAGCVCAGLVGAAGAEATGRQHGALVASAMATITAVGVYLAVPDTEVAAAACGALAVVTAATALRSGSNREALIRIIRPRTQDGGGAGVLAVPIAVAVAYGSAGRPTAAIGAFACFGLLAVLPVARLAADARIPWPLTIAGHAATAAATARLAGLETSWTVAAARSAGILSLSLAAVLLYAATTTTRSDRRADPPGEVA